MSRREPLTAGQIKDVQETLVKLCKKHDMELAVLFIQGEGPLEMFDVVKEDHWRVITNGIKRVVKHFSDHMRQLMAERN